MTDRRKEIEEALDSLQAALAANDGKKLVDCFSEDCTWVNSVLEEPIRGRDALAEYVATWTDLANTWEWYLIDGERAVVRWEERPGAVDPDGLGYAGNFNLVYGGDGKFATYECFFDPAKVAAAWKAAAAGG